MFRCACCQPYKANLHSKPPHQFYLWLKCLAMLDWIQVGRGVIEVQCGPHTRGVPRRCLRPHTPSAVGTRGRRHRRARVYDRGPTVDFYVPHPHLNPVKHTWAKFFCNNHPLRKYMILISVRSSLDATTALDPSNSWSESSSVLSCGKRL